MRHMVAHGLDAAAARQVAERAFESYRARFARYHPELSWRSPTEADASFSALGLSLRGTIELLPGAIAFDLDVPLVLRVFTDRAVAVVEREVKQWCEAHSPAVP